MAWSSEFIVGEVLDILLYRVIGERAGTMELDSTCRVCLCGLCVCASSLVVHIERTGHMHVGQPRQASHDHSLPNRMSSYLLTPAIHPGRSRSGLISRLAIFGLAALRSYNLPSGAPRAVFLVCSASSSRVLGPRVAFATLFATFSLFFLLEEGHQVNPCGCCTSLD